MNRIKCKSTNILELKVAVFFCLLFFCKISVSANNLSTEQIKPTSGKKDLSTIHKESSSEKLFKDEVVLEKALKYDNHTLKDNYMYGKIKREFQWDKIKQKLAFVDSIQSGDSRWAILQNYKNKNGQAPLVKKNKRDAYNNIADTYGVERYQGIPLYLSHDTFSVERYGLDGSLVKLINNNDTLSKFIDVEALYIGGDWNVPKKFVKTLPDTTKFKHVIIVDVKNQNIATLEKEGSKWLIRSMNPATTGKHNPPHMQETPLGIFVIQEKKSKMFYLKDGTSDIAGFAPNASRFCNGGYIHGVPLVYPNQTPAEFSWTLGTIPRSHMCVRNATSHAKYIYDKFPVNSTLIFVID